MRACVRACVCVCVRARARACACVVDLNVYIMCKQQYLFLSYNKSTGGRILTNLSTRDDDGFLEERPDDSFAAGRSGQAAHVAEEVVSVVRHHVS